MKYKKFFEMSEELFLNNIEEYEIVGYYYLAEKAMKQRLIEEPESSKLWFTMCLFYLKR